MSATAAMMNAWVSISKGDEGGNETKESKGEGRWETGSEKIRKKDGMGRKREQKSARVRVIFEGGKLAWRGIITSSYGDGCPIVQQPDCFLFCGSVCAPLPE